MKEKSRAPVVQKPLTIEKPTLEDGIGSKVTVEINEKKVSSLLEQQFLKHAKKTRFIFLHFVIMMIYVLQVFAVSALLKLKE